MVLVDNMRVITGKPHHGLFSIVFGALREIRQCELSGDLFRVEWREECALCWARVQARVPREEAPCESVLKKMSS